MSFSFHKRSFIASASIGFRYTFIGAVLLMPMLVYGQANRELTRPDTTPKKASEKRTALVIGNSTYVTSPLTNPANDAADMAVALKELDFEVISGVNQSRAAMIRLVRQFGERLKARGGVGLFYYAGHGVQVEGRNFLVPTDAAIRSENEVELEAVDVSRVLVELENAGNSLNIVVLDACRNNPFSRSWRSTNDGLAQINAPTGTMIAYSTAPGKVASDGVGRNAPYTAALLKAMRMPDLSLSDVFMQVRADVQRVTKRQQTPWEASSIIGRFYFQAGTGLGRQGGLADAQVDQQYWDSVKDSRNAADIQNYLKEFPNGRFAALARLRSSQLVDGSAAGGNTPTGSSKPSAPRTAKEWFDQGVAHLDEQDLFWAIDAFTKAISLNADYWEAYAWRASANFPTGGHTDAFADINKAIKNSPQNASFYLTRSSFHCHYWQALGTDKKSFDLAKQDEATVIKLGGKVDDPCK